MQGIRFVTVSISDLFFLRLRPSSLTRLSHEERIRFYWDDALPTYALGTHIGRKRLKVVEKGHNLNIERSRNFLLPQSPTTLFPVMQCESHRNPMKYRWNVQRKPIHNLRQFNARNNKRKTPMRIPQKEDSLHNATLLSTSETYSTERTNIKTIKSGNEAKWQSVGRFGYVKFDTTETRNFRQMNFGPYPNQLRGF